MIRIMSASDVATTAPSPEDIVIVCDPDPQTALAAAEAVEGQRTAVFIGDLQIEEDRAAAEELARELEAGLRPGNSG